MLFPVQKKAYRGLMGTMKFLAKVLPMPKPTLFTGTGSALDMCDVIGGMGFRKLLIVTDKVLVEIGLLDSITDKLSEIGVEYVIFDGVLPDPTYDQVDAGLAVLKANNCDGVLAFGGGSPIDAAKVIAARATNDKPIEKLAGMFRVWTATLPLFAVPTTAGTGSEATIAAVVSDPVTHNKTPLIDPKLVPTMAALDGSLMTGLPSHVTAATGMDALTHAIEAFISVNATGETDSYAIVATRLIMENLSKVYSDGSDVKARQNMALASYYAGLAFTRASVGYVHAIAHNFGAYYHTPHGIGNAIVLPYVLDFSKEDISDRLAELAEVSGLRSGSESNSQMAQKFIDKIRAMLKEFDIPFHLEALERRDIPNLAKAALKEAHRNYPVPKYMNQAQCESMLHRIAV